MSVLTQRQYSLRFNHLPSSLGPLRWQSGSRHCGFRIPDSLNPPPSLRFRCFFGIPLRCLHCSASQGHNPFIYFCRYAKDTLRLATLPSRAGGGPVDGGGTDTSVSSSSGGGWGSRVKLNVQKAILGLTCHHVDMQLLVLTADGQLRGYAIVGPGGDALTPIYAVPVRTDPHTTAHDQ